MSSGPARLPRMRGELREGPRYGAGREGGGWALRWPSGRVDAGPHGLPLGLRHLRPHLTPHRERTRTKLQFLGGREGVLEPDVVCFACMLLFPMPRQYFSLPYALVKTAFVV